MADTDEITTNSTPTEQTASVEGPVSFFDRPHVKVEQIPIGSGIPIGIEQVSNPALGIGGAYGTWGPCYDNETLQNMVEQVLGERLEDTERLNLTELGFDCRHHLLELSGQEMIDLEVKVGARFLSEAAAANGWEPSEVEAVLLGTTGPVTNDYTERAAREAGIPEEAMKVSIHKACDGSVAGLNLALNPDLPVNKSLKQNLAEKLLGKKILVGGIEGLSRFMRFSHDKNAFQLFGNGAGVIGLIPGKSMKFIVGQTYEVFDDEGVLQVRMLYPYTGKVLDQSLIEVTQTGDHSIRVAGKMHEPESGSGVVMAGPMGMVKLFVRNGARVIQDVYRMYQKRIAEMGLPGKELAVAIVHHANYKINKLIEKNLLKEGINVPMPWLLREFGNVSAASNMIAFLRQLGKLNPGDNIMFDGFGAGTYYDVLAVQVGG
jgi:3-oxoacyl-[acyl-carrier-protein] synthase III